MSHSVHRRWSFQRIHVLGLATLVAGTVWFAACAAPTKSKPATETTERRSTEVPATETRARPISRSFADKYFYAGQPVAMAAAGPVTVLTNIGYAVGYSEQRKCPLWAAFRLDRVENPPVHPRLTRFLVDNRTVSRVSHNDYTNSGYDRGHMAPNHAIDSRYGEAAQRETFFMSNICPQCPGLNQETWQGLEALVADTYAQQFETVWEVTGPVFSASPRRLASGVSIPSRFYKIVVDELDGNPSILAVEMSQTTHGAHTLQSVLTTVDAVEAETGLDFFADLPDDLEDRLEAAPPDNHWGLGRTLSRNGRARIPCTD